LEATPADIEALPNLQPGDRLSDHRQLSNGELWLMRFAINTGASQRSNVVTRFSRWDASRRYIGANLHKIKHWRLVQGDYSDAPDIPATWFIDPPYHRSGRFYRTNDVRYPSLAEWVGGRRGDVVVCEQDGAGWLPFRPLAGHRAARGRMTTEVIYTRGPAFISSTAA
jgi:hypothetical protein